jgi:ABC-2 type transport system ATP-binding protein
MRALLWALALFSRCVTWMRPAHQHGVVHHMYLRYTTLHNYNLSEDRMPESNNGGTPALKIDGLAKVYENGFEALKGISLEVTQGDFFALLGPNGAGKSTTIGIICSLVAKSAGQVRVHGVSIDEDFAGAKKYIGIVPQEFNFNMFEKVVDIVTNQAGYYGLPRHIACERAEKYLR